MRLLLVEDEPVIALDLEMLSLSAGHDVVGIADTLQTALDLAASKTPQAALIDINLRDGFSGVKVSEALSGRHGMTVGFVTGNVDQVPQNFAGAVAVLEKPYTQAGVEEMLAILQDRLEGGPGDGRPPLYAKLASPP